MDETKRFKIFVHGCPKPQGSKRIVQPKGVRRPMLIEANPEAHACWRNAVYATAYARAKEIGWAILEGPVVFQAVFYFRRPLSHFKKRTPGTAGENNDLTSLGRRSPFPIGRAYDVDKLLRSVGDSLSGVVYRDDKQTVDMHGHIRWGGTFGATICVESAESCEVVARVAPPQKDEFTLPLPLEGL